MIWKRLVLAASISFAALGCRHHEASSPYEAMSMLGSPEWKERRRAADDLGSQGPPASAIPALYGAILREQNPKAFGAMLIALGGSGIAEARPLIDARVNDPDEDMQRWARRALKKWLVKNLLWSEDQDLPPPPHPVYSPPAALPPGVPASMPTPGLGAPATPSASPPPAPPTPGGPPPGTSI